MSLTRVIKNKGNESNPFNIEFINELKIMLPNDNQLIDINGNPLSRDYDLLVTHRYNHNHNYAFVGTCFDILARLELIRYSNNYTISELLNEHSIFSHISYKMIQLRDSLEINALQSAKSQDEIDLIRLSFSNEYVDKYKNIFINIHAKLEDFSEISDNDLKIEDVYNIFPDIYVLAKLEQVYRSGMQITFKDLVDLYNQEFYLIDLDVLKKDLAYLYGIFRAVFINKGLVRKTSNIVFNPVFGEIAIVVGGADGDIIIDNVLYDFKCIKSNKYNQDYWLQLMGYYTLNKLSKTNNIDKVGLYLARHGKFEIFNDLPELRQDFTERVFSEYYRRKD